MELYIYKSVLGLFSCLLLLSPTLAFFFQPFKISTSSCISSSSRSSSNIACSSSRRAWVDHLVVSIAGPALLLAEGGGQRIAQGIITIADGVDLSQLGDSPALFVTVRLGAKGPVIGSHKFDKVAFPFEFSLYEADVYAPNPEEASKISDSIKKKDLAIFARLDKDGDSGTRDAEDLVGAGVVYKFDNDQESQWSRADIKLKGRGAFGKFVTQKRKE